MPIEFLHIDDNFINKYSGIVAIHKIKRTIIFLVVAQFNPLPLITWDIQMTKIGREVKIDIHNPVEWMASEQPQLSGTIQPIATLRLILTLCQFSYQDLTMSRETTIG